MSKTTKSTKKSLTAKELAAQGRFTPGIGVRLHWLSQPEQAGDPELLAERREICTFLGLPVPA
jgi:hypothetical protein